MDFFFFLLFQINTSMQPALIDNHLCATFFLFLSFRNNAETYDSIRDIIALMC